MATIQQKSICILFDGNILWKSICILFYGNYLWFLLWGIKSSFHMSVGAEQAREVVTLVASEAPFSQLWVET